MRIRAYSFHVDYHLSLHCSYWKNVSFFALFMHVETLCQIVGISVHIRGALKF